MHKRAYFYCWWNEFIFYFYNEVCNACFRSFLNTNIIIPGKDDYININRNFFFIICQNEINNLGRNDMPDILQQKIRNIHYPNQSIEEIENICKIKKKKE